MKPEETIAVEQKLDAIKKDEGVGLRMALKRLEARTANKYPPSRRSPTIKAKAHLEEQENLYSMCKCGSGLKFKFCCHKK